MIRGCKQKKKAILLRMAFFLLLFERWMANAYGCVTRTETPLPWSGMVRSTVSISVRMTVMKLDSGEVT